MGVRRSQDKSSSTELQRGEIKNHRLSIPSIYTIDCYYYGIRGADWLRQALLCSAYIYSALMYGLIKTDEILFLS